MDLRFSEGDLAFQREVRAFVRDNLPAGLQAKVERGEHLSKNDRVTWQKILHERGWGAPSWPKEYGGTGWSLTERYLFYRELDLAAAPNFAPFGLDLVGPVIFTFGSEAQKRRFLPPILSADEAWCQGFSEPGAGSDLASLRTRAEDQGDHYLVNGQKIWTTQAHEADMLFCLARTNPGAKAQQGISFLLIDLRSQGITIRPIISLDLAHSLNEVFFDDVVVPKANLIGEEGRGWDYAKFLLGRERTRISGVHRSRRQLARLRNIAAGTFVHGRLMIDDPVFKRRLAEIESDLSAVEFTELRALSAEAAGQPMSVQASILKISGSELQQRIAALLVEAVGDEAAELGGDGATDGDSDGVMAAYLYGRAVTIYGGTNEIQRNIIAKHLLGQRP